MAAGHLQSGLAIEPFGACPWPCRKPHARAACLVEDIAGTFEKGAGDAAALVGLFHEQSKDVAVSWVGGRKADDLGILYPDENAWVIDEPANIFHRDARGITKRILAHPGAYFHDTRDIRSGCFADQKVSPSAQLGAATFIMPSTGLWFYWELRERPARRSVTAAVVRAYD
jgi:hypothetical protein